MLQQAHQKLKFENSWLKICWSQSNVLTYSNETIDKLKIPILKWDNVSVINYNCLHCEEANKWHYLLSRIPSGKWIHVLSKCFCLPCHYVSISYGNNMQILSFTDPLSGGTWYAAKQTGTHNSCLPWEKSLKSTKCIHFS